MDIGIPGVIGFLLMMLGGLVSFVAMIVIVGEAFRESFLWGIGCLLIGPVLLLFVIMNWELTKRTFLIGLAGNFVVASGFLLYSRSFF